MSVIGNIIWLLFGGIVIAIEYLVGSIVLILTIAGIPFGIQTLKMAALAIWPFGRDTRVHSRASGCLYIIMNVIWLLFGGIWIALTHMIFGLILCITIIGIPFGLQHFKLTSLALNPFGRDIIRI
ncbi:MAG TPA: YccF domain-containing protein [Bacteroidales bacterium]|mgnify:CR=1 FL=1|nr:YccF domain-containing protein [Bacteroidales bacterium]HPF02356.1 YccF domain-containing protein [Bacteroidales bacterium]HPJ58201.1 YccF domain-containing protein [Bacteroidales bacterium]HPR11532.1 YccF domain-containing protein [Bacteroidales bacterium]HRW84274.1 YccF domain-containing protein [Bacteroidales bacterium]